MKRYWRFSSETECKEGTMKDHVVLLALTLLTCFSTLQVARAQQRAQPVAKQVAVNGTTIRYWEQGSGVPVVFVHGAISDHRAWELQREPIAKRYRFIAIDRRYFGTAPWPDAVVERSQETDVADLGALIRELKIGPVFLVGSSGGALVSLRLAVQHPELVRGLFLNEPLLRSTLTNPTEQKLASENSKALGEVRANVQAAAKARKMEEAARLLIDAVNGQPGSFDVLSPELKAMFVDNARTLTLNESTSSAPITCAQLGQLKVPVTLTMGQLTVPAFKLQVEAAHRCIPGSQLVTIPAARHTSVSQNPAAFNEALLAFLKRN